MTRDVPAAAMTRTSAFAAHLDLMRGVAALAVVAFHIRYKFFLDYTDLVDPAPATQAFYVITSFGHDAVMVFFVLSGFLIAGTVLNDLRRGRWSWRRYLVNRLTRLYVVLVPGLVLTALWDQLGLHLFPAHIAYTGAPAAWTHDFFDVHGTSGWAVFGKNLLFLQSVAGTPPLGSNSPLWSLTNEFAYYVLFPAIMVAVWPGVRWPARIANALFGLVMAWHFGERILLYFPLWLLGLLPLQLRLGAFATRSSAGVLSLAAGAAILGAAIVRHTGTFNNAMEARALEAGDLLVAVVCALALCVLRGSESLPAAPAYATWTARVAALSFTLYVFHMPFLIFARALVNGGASWAVTVPTMLASVALLLLTLAYAAVMWWLFERRTPAVREAVTAAWLKERK